MAKMVDYEALEKRLIERVKSLEAYHRVNNLSRAESIGICGLINGTQILLEELDEFIINTDKESE